LVSVVQSKSAVLLCSYFDWKICHFRNVQIIGLLLYYDFQNPSPILYMILPDNEHIFM